MASHQNFKAIQLPPHFDGAEVEKIRRELIALPADSDLCFDAAKVETVSVGYLQFLLSALKTFPKLAIANETPSLRAAFADYGIADRIPPAAPMPKADAASAPGKKILTIDDSRTMRDMLRLTLSEAGYTVFQAIDGQNGLDELAKNPVDLIITDINMPKLDGYGVIREVRRNPHYESLPILVLSTESEQQSKEIAKDAGATGWIVKPFNPQSLISVVEQVCR